ncbi:DNA replication/repair protein RecF [Croceimicrobium sp.]|uniref:DNA replication/repair protein RecF n=1 Tax=Croceimicrobium sp. TaxID=2828340 RepID=UPI003BAB785D
MHLRDLHLLNFKSWTEGQFEFSPKLNCFVGLNGGGKTNLLDAIHYLCLSKSYFGNRDQKNIKHEEDFFMIEGNFLRQDENEHLHISLKKGAKKILKRNKKEYEKLAEHIGAFPAVVISPYDRDLITDSSDTRRRFLDNVISQGNNEYLFHLMRYHKALQQRNRLLKFFAANHQFDAESLDLYDQQMVEHGMYISKARQQFCEELGPRIQHYYHWLSEGREAATLDYRSHFGDEPLVELRSRHEKDRVLQYSSWGVHRDDLKFSLDDDSVRDYASQGQQKSYLIALKLAQYEFIRDHQKMVPILLLDDIFDKLDEARVARLVKLVHDSNFGQIFITDTHEDRTTALVKQIDPEARIINVTSIIEDGSE